MNTEEIMKLADAYAAAYMSFSESKARAALEAALSAKQGEAVAWLFKNEGDYRSPFVALMNPFRSTDLGDWKSIPLYPHPAPVNTALLEFAQWVLSLKTGGMIEGKARAAIAAVESNASTHSLNSANSLE